MKERMFHLKYLGGLADDPKYDASSKFLYLRRSELRGHMKRSQLLQLLCQLL